MHARDLLFEKFLKLVRTRAERASAGAGFDRNAFDFRAPNGRCNTDSFRGHRIRYVRKHSTNDDKNQSQHLRNTYVNPRTTVQVRKGMSGTREKKSVERAAK
mmetsp:Transcript_3994/g.7318  ORF Transcript_3994/g.7318 Transcript_3994/m.7318 type:complete len:102 (-) Transcript_3994:12-317(-)